MAARWLALLTLTVAPTQGCREQESPSVQAIEQITTKGNVQRSTGRQTKVTVPAEVERALAAIMEFTERPSLMLRVVQEMPWGVAVQHVAGDTYAWGGMRIDVAGQTFEGATGVHACDLSYAGRFLVNGGNWKVSDFSTGYVNEEACPSKEAWDRYNRRYEAPQGARTWAEMQRDLVIQR